jgi:N-acetylneuraminic acid mutarotase
VHHAQAAFVDGKLHVFGGYVTGALLPGTLVPGAGPAGWPRTPLSFRLDPAVGRWEPLPDMPVPRSAGGAAVLEGKVYLVGGVGMDGFLDTVHVFDPATGEYAEAAPLPKPRDHLTVFGHGGKMYALAGRENAAGQWDDLETSEVYDPANDTWAPLPPAPLGRGGQAGAPWRGILPLFGGERAEGEFTVYDDAHAYDPMQGRWVELPRLPAPRHGMGSAAWGERVFLMGGATPTALLASVVSLGPGSAEAS